MTTKPRFLQIEEDSRQFKMLQKEVKLLLASLNRSKRVENYIKAFLLPVLYYALFITALLSSMPSTYFLCSFGMGLFIVLIYLNLLHEAVHDNLFRSKKMNRFYIILFDLIGANSFIFKKRHVIFHHHYPNVAGWDTDIEQSGPIKIFPFAKTKYFHKYQHILFVILYPLYLFNWVLIRDFKDFFDSSRVVRKLVEIPTLEYVKIIFFKFLYLFNMLILPVMFFNQAITTVLVGTIIMLFSASVFSLIALLTPHVNNHNSYFKNHENKTIQTSWFQLQLATTNDIAVNNWVTRNLLGNFNFHLAHHLFPKISNVYAPEITNVIRTFARKNQLNYRTYSIINCLKSHLNLLRANSVSEQNFIN